MFENLKASITSVLSDNEIGVYNEYYNIDLIKDNNRNIGFLSVKGIEKINGYQNMQDEKSFELFVTVECKVIAKKDMTSNTFSKMMNDVYTDFLLSEDVIPVSINIENLKINSLYSRLESNIILKFRYYLSETA